MNKPITVQTLIKAPIQKVWELWTSPKHIKNWCFASDTWGVGDVENELTLNGKFKTHMMAKDGSAGFDFSGVYNDIKEYEMLSYTLDDGRKVSVTFTDEGAHTKVVEIFDPENEHSEEMQSAGWQAILDSFKRYVETIE